MAEQGQGSGWNDPFPRLRWTLVNMRTCRRSPYTPAPAPSCRTLAAVQCCALPSWAWQGEGRGGKTRQLQSLHSASTSTALCWVSSHEEWSSKHVHIKQSHAATKTFWSSACFLYFQSYFFSCEQIPCSSMCMPSYKVENLQKWVFSPPE